MYILACHTDLRIYSISCWQSRRPSWHGGWPNGRHAPHARGILVFTRSSASPVRLPLLDYSFDSPRNITWLILHHYFQFFRFKALCSALRYYGKSTPALPLRPYEAFQTMQLYCCTVIVHLTCPSAPEMLAGTLPFGHRPRKSSDPSLASQSESRTYLLFSLSKRLLSLFLSCLRIIYLLLTPSLPPSSLCDFAPSPPFYPPLASLARYLQNNTFSTMPVPFHRSMTPKRAAALSFTGFLVPVLFGAWNLVQHALCLCD